MNKYIWQPEGQALAAFLVFCLLLMAAGIASSVVYAANDSNHVKGPVPVFEQTEFEPMTSSEVAVLRVAQNASAKVKCPRRSIAEVESSVAVRVFCKQSKGNEWSKYELTTFSPAFESGDVLKLLQYQMIKKNWYYRTSDQPVEDAIRRNFREVSAASFNGGDNKLGWTARYTYVHFTFKKQSCFGFRKNRVEKVLFGYYCGNQKNVYSSKQIKSMVKKIDLR